MNDNRSAVKMPEPTNPILIQHLAPKNFLSFGPDNPGIDLRALNLFIGPNGSGKSNLFEAINLMRATPKEVRDVTRKGGGVTEWIWKGDPEGRASVEWFVRNLPTLPPLRHSLGFCSMNQAFSLQHEEIELASKPAKPIYSDRVLSRGLRLKPTLVSQKNGRRSSSPIEIEPDRSILAQRRDPELYPELAWLAQNYEKIRLYREWSFGRNAVLRSAQAADLRNDFLEEDFSNLGLFLNRIKTRFPLAKRAILAGLKDLYEGISDFEVSVQGGTVQVFFHEGDYSIPATRLSDGTLRYLCLLAILCDPVPPPLICLEEPELGLHPDILPKVADLLRTASQRTQLLVTTHSDILVDAMTDTPEVVVVCSKEQGQTKMQRLNADDLSEWLKKYRLGDLWISGEIGGTRW